MAHRGGQSAIREGEDGKVTKAVHRQNETKFNAPKIK